MKTFIDEAMLMRSFRHEHVLSMLGISFDIYGQPLVILPYLGNGDLLSYLRSRSKVSSMMSKLLVSVVSDRAFLTLNFKQKSWPNSICIHIEKYCFVTNSISIKS